MNDCTRLSDRMPEVAGGQDRWMPEELEHLRSCHSCGQEWQLVRLTRSLGDGRLPRIDPMKTSRALLHRLERARLRRRAGRVYGMGGLAVAASLAAFLWIRQPMTPPTPNASLAQGLEIPLPELDELDPVELDSVLSTMDELGEPEGEELDPGLDIWEG